MQSSKVASQKCSDVTQRDIVQGGTQLRDMWLVHSQIVYNFLFLVLSRRQVIIQVQH